MSVLPCKETLPFLPHPVGYTVDSGGVYVARFGLTVPRALSELLNTKITPSGLTLSLEYDYSYDEGSYFNINCLYLNIKNNSGSVISDDIEYQVYDENNTRQYRGQVAVHELISGTNMKEIIDMSFGEGCKSYTVYYKTKDMNGFKKIGTVNAEGGNGTIQEE